MIKSLDINEVQTPDNDKPNENTNQDGNTSTKLNLILKDKSILLSKY